MHMLYVWSGSNWQDDVISLDPLATKWTTLLILLIFHMMLHCGSNWEVWLFWNCHYSNEKLVQTLNHTDEEYWWFKPFSSDFLENYFCISLQLSYVFPSTSQKMPAIHIPNLTEISPFKGKKRNTQQNTMGGDWNTFIQFINFTVHVYQCSLKLQSSMECHCTLEIQLVN